MEGQDSGRCSSPKPHSESHYISPALKVTKYFPLSPNHSSSIPKKSNKSRNTTTGHRSHSLPNTGIFLNFSRKIIKSTFRYRHIAPKKLQVPVGCTLSRGYSPRLRTPHYAPIPIRACELGPRRLLGLIVRFRVPFPFCADSRGLCSPFGPAEAQPRLQCAPPPSRSIPSGANLLRSRGEPSMRRLDVGVQGRGARPCEVPCPLSGRLFGCCRHLMATRVEEAARGRGGGAEEAIEAGRGGRRRSPRQKVSLVGARLVAGPEECLGCFFGVHLFTLLGYL